MSPEQRLSAKTHSRITDANLAIKRAETFIARYPAASATPVVRDIKLALVDLLDEINSPSAVHSG